MPITACLRTAMTSGALAIFLATTSSFANDPPKKQDAWASTVKAAPGTTAAAFDEKQMTIVGKVNGYFNALTTLKGNFQQTDPDKKTSRGKFLLKKPGQFRFEYARPSRKIIISDGKFLAIQDHDLKTSDTYELDNTPFRVLLKADVDLMRDAKVLEVVDLPDSIVVTLQDKSPDTPGAIRLIMTNAGADLELKEWITYDAQGLETRVAVADLTKGEAMNSALFKRESFTNFRMQGN